MGKNRKLVRREDDPLEHHAFESLLIGLAAHCDVQHFVIAYRIENSADLSLRGHGFSKRDVAASNAIYEAIAELLMSHGLADKINNAIVLADAEESPERN